MQSFDAGNPIAERALEAVERALELQRPKGVASSLHKLERKSTEYCEGLLRTKNVVRIGWGMRKPETPRHSPNRESRC